MRQSALFLESFATESAINYAVMDIISRLKPPTAKKEKKSKEERKKEKLQLLPSSSVQEGDVPVQRPPLPLPLPSPPSLPSANMEKMLSDLTALIALYEEAALASLAAFQVLILT